MQTIFTPNYKKGKKLSSYKNCNLEHPINFFGFFNMFRATLIRICINKYIFVKHVNLLFSETKLFIAELLKFQYLPHPQTKKQTKKWKSFYLNWSAVAYQSNSWNLSQRTILPTLNKEIYYKKKKIYWYNSQKKKKS